jgi:hypothetical protein
MVEDFFLQNINPESREHPYRGFGHTSYKRCLDGKVFGKLGRALPIQMKREIMHL